MDVGCERDELYFEVRPFAYDPQSFADLSIILPSWLLPSPGIGMSSPQFSAAAANSLPTDIPLSIVFIRTQEGCRSAWWHFVQLLPSHLRQCTDIFYGSCTAKHRASILKQFKLGEVRVLFATEAFGLGCDISFIKYVIQWGNADSSLSLEQHWGRGGRGQEPLVVNPSTLVGKRCTCIWFTSKDTFGPLINSPSAEKPAKHPFTNATPVDHKPAVTTRQRLFANSPALYHLANPEGGNACVSGGGGSCDLMSAVASGVWEGSGMHWSTRGARYHPGYAVEAVSSATFRITTTTEIA